jgi:septal ring factor EnvC (AmiA/AmiB activator)
MGVNKVTLLQDAILSLTKDINKNKTATKEQAEELKKLKEQYDKVNKLMPQYRKKHEEINEELEKANKVTSKLDKTKKGFFEKLKTAVGTLARYGLAYKALNIAQRLFTELTIGSAKQAIEFEKSLANLGAVAGASSEEVAMLGKNALKVAGSTKFTAEEIVGLQTELSKLGFTADDVVASTQAIAFTAQALGSPLAATAEQVGKVINQFDLLIEQSEFIGDVLVTSINNSALSFDSFGTAIQYVGPIAKNLGLTLEQTAGAMAVLADNGFTASRIGTGLRGIRNW